MVDDHCQDGQVPRAPGPRLIIYLFAFVCADATGVPHTTHSTPLFDSALDATVLGARPAGASRVIDRAATQGPGKGAAAGIHRHSSAFIGIATLLAPKMKPPGSCDHE